MRERLRVYHEQTEPLIAHYEERGVLARIDGTRAPDEVNAAIREALEAVAATP